MNNDVYAPDPTVASTTYFKPLFSFSPSAHSFDISSLAPIIFLLVFVVWVIYTFAAAYHWFRYGHQSWLAVPALVAHLFVSGVIIIYMMSGIK